MAALEGRQQDIKQTMDRAERTAAAWEPWVLLGGTTVSGGLQVHTAERLRARGLPDGEGFFHLDAGS